MERILVAVDEDPMREHVVRKASELDAGMNVMGCAGRHGLERLRALGRVSRAVMESATRPVLIVPEPG